MSGAFEETHEREDVCALPLVRRLAATLGQDPAGWCDGDPLPRGWHVIMFTSDTPQQDLRADGMAGTGVPLPDVDMPRVVMGGRRLSFTGDIAIGSRVRRESSVKSIVPKTGRSSGPLVIVTVLNEISTQDASQPEIVEEQDYVFRGESATESRTPAEVGGEPAPRSADITREITPDETLLFRYSAVTFNPHRIHFDHPYTLERERYPALVVNGGLTALLTTELFREEARREPLSISTRNLAPLYCNEAMRIHATRGSPSWHLWVEGARGAVALEAAIE
jgi:3-methylfumaryl-CoA hydratase